MIRNMHLPSLNNKVMIANVLFLITTTAGIVLIVGGLSVMILASTLPGKVSDMDILQRSVVSVLGQIPGFPINMYDLYNTSLTAAGMVSWIIGLDILVVGLGLWRRNILAKWAAIIIFALSGFFDFVQFLYLGLVGAPLAIVGLFVNALILYLLWKVDFTFEAPAIIPMQSETPTVTFAEAESSRVQEIETAVPGGDESIQEDAGVPDLSAVTREPVMAAQKETVVPFPAMNEIRIIVREIPVVVEKDTGGVRVISKEPKTRVVVRKSQNGIPIVIVETKVERSSETIAEKGKKLAKHKSNNA